MREHIAPFLRIAEQRPLTASELAEFNGLEKHGGFDAGLGIRYTHLAWGEVRAFVVAGPQHHQPWGLVNGGLYCSLAESVASLAGVIAAGGPVVGVNNNTNFIKPVRSGVIEAAARPLQNGSRTQLWEVDMTHEGQLVAKTTLRTMVIAG